MPRLLKQQQGFTMAEIMVVVLVIGVTLAASIPSFSKLLRTNNLIAGGDMLTEDFRLMRQRAVSEGVPYLVTLSSGYYYTVKDTNGDGTYSSGESYWGPFYMPKGAYVSSLSNGFTSTWIQFRPNGTSSQGGNINMYNDRGKQLTLTLLKPTGQVFVKKDAVDAGA
jgi:prepilin-type N-terminal cleavage/methylation domain-containing protein